MASSMVKIKDKEEVAFLRKRVKHWRAGRDEAIEDISCKEFSFAQVCRTHPRWKARILTRPLIERGYQATLGLSLRTADQTRLSRATYCVPSFSPSTYFIPLSLSHAK